MGSNGGSRGGGSGFQGEMLQLATLLLLNLSPLTRAALPSFLANLEEDSTYHQCDSAMCWWTNFDIDFVTDFRVPNSSLVIPDYDWNWWEVKMSSLLEECAPSLPLSQVAFSFSACNDIDDSSIKESCFGVQRDWLDEKGAINTSLMQMYSEMPKAESFINECLALDGDGVSEVEEIFDYHDYDYYDDYYYSNDGNDLVEEKSGRRQKRSSELELGELKARVKQREERRKGQRNGKVKKQRNGKNGQKRRRTKEGQGAKEIKTKRKKEKKTQKGKEKKKAQQGKTKSRKQAASKKKERREEKRALKKIGLKKAPTQLVLGKLKCIWLAVDLALEDCGKEVLKNSNID